MDKQVAETIWMPYPKYKPEKVGIYYDVTYKNQKTDTLYYNGIGFYDNPDDTEYPHWEVISYATKPSPYDPEAKTVNFATADLVMRESMHKRLGIVFKSLISNEYIEYADGRYYRFTNYEDRDSDEERTRRAYGFEDDEGISIAEIMGEWERVE